MTSDIGKVAKLVRGSGQTWLIGPRGDTELVAARLSQTLTGTYRSYHDLYADDPSGDTLSDDVLLTEQQENPDRVNALLQATGSVSDPRMLVMVWRIIRGDAIAKLHLDYVYERHFWMRVELEDPETGRRVGFETDDIVNATVLRHLSIMKLEDGPIFEGFAPLRS